MKKGIDLNHLNSRGVAGAKTDRRIKISVNEFSYKVTIQNFLFGFKNDFHFQIQ